MSKPAKWVKKHPLQAAAIGATAGLGGAGLAGIGPLAGLLGVGAAPAVLGEGAALAGASGMTDLIGATGAAQMATPSVGTGILGGNLSGISGKGLARAGLMLNGMSQPQPLPAMGGMQSRNMEPTATNTVPQYSPQMQVGGRVGIDPKNPQIGPGMDLNDPRILALLMQAQGRV